MAAVPRYHAMNALDNHKTLQDMAHASEGFNDITVKDQQGAIKEINQITGISTSHTPPGVVNFYQHQENNIIHPDTLAILSKHNADDRDVLDYEIPNDGS